MSPLLIVCIVILALEFVALIASLTVYVVRDQRKLKALEKKIRNSITAEDIAAVKKEVFGLEEEKAEAVEAVEEVAEQPVEEAVEEIVEQPEVVVAEEVVEQPAEEVSEETDEEDESEDAEESAPVIAPIERADSKSRIPFADKMIYLDKKTQGYYNAIMNKFKGLRKINVRVSTKGVSFRLGRDLVAKLTVRGKTLRLHLALDVNAYDAKVYFQKDLGDVKSYVEVPFAVKIKSDRGLKNAIKLIDDLVAGKGIEEKTRFNETDGVEDLKVIALKNRK